MSGEMKAVAGEVISVEPVPQGPDEESIFVRHARRELELIGEDSDVIEGVLKVMAAFGSLATSGGSHPFVTSMINELINLQTLSPITNDPAEWMYHTGDVWGSPEGIWQNIRDSRLFSSDHGMTYWSVSDGSKGGDIKHVYSSRPSLR